MRATLEARIAELEREAAETAAAIQQGQSVVGVIGGPTARRGMRERDPEAWAAWRRIEQWTFAQKLGVEQGIAFTDFIAVIAYALKRIDELDGPRIGMR